MKLGLRTIGVALGAVFLAAFLVFGARLVMPGAAHAVADTGFLCSAGSQDGAVCSTDDECPGGVCVLIQGVCDGGDVDGFPCDCPGGTCASGTCSGGVFDGDSCGVGVGSGSCSAGIQCVSSQRICESGDEKGFGCLRPAQCAGAPCVSTGSVCVAGDFQDYSCVDDADCSTGGGPVDSCVQISGGPTPTPTPPGTGCAGDCGGDGNVTVDEIVRGVNIALGTLTVDQCSAADRDGDGTVTVDELVAAVHNALVGCS